MKNILLLMIILLLASCDDGDIITTDLDFQDTDLQACAIITNGTTFNHTFYKLGNGNNEGLVLTLSTPDNIVEAIATSGIFYGPYAINSTNIFEFRKFSGEPNANYFCSAIPPSFPGINEVFAATSGTFTIETNIAFQDDEDGVPADQERVGDTDGDGIPDSLDMDDDGDNIPTSLEGVILVGGVIDIVNSRDDDGDGILNYLDDDDDNDGIPTKQEDLNRDLNPANDFAPNQILPNYRTDAVAIASSPPVNQRILHTFKQTKSQSIILQDLVLNNGSEELIFEIYTLGIYLRPTETITID
jgi:hypothetical protein